MSTYNLCFEQEYEKISGFFYLTIFIFGGKSFILFQQACFRNGNNICDVLFVFLHIKDLMKRGLL